MHPRVPPTYWGAYVTCAGSNIFNIFMCLGFPWLRRHALLHFHELAHADCCEKGCPAAHKCWPRGMVQDEARAITQTRKSRQMSAVAVGIRMV